MKKLLYALLLIYLTIANAAAQTFGAGGSLAAKDRQEKSIASPQLSSPSAPAKADDQQTAGLDAESDENPFMTDSVGNFAKDANSNSYDNSLGKVIRFKIVDGEVQFQEDKERMILIYYDDYKVSKGMDNIVRCTMRLFVLNDLETKVSSLGFKLRWPEISTGLQMQQIEPGVSKYSDIMLLGNGCFTMDKTPTLEINRCRVKGLSEEQCADKVKWFAKSRK